MSLPDDEQSGRDRFVRLVLLGFAAIAASWLMVSLWFPMAHDLGLYSWVGDVIVRGGLQYRDAWDMHGPLVGYIMAGAIAVFGRNTAGLRVLDLIFLAIGVVGLLRILRTLVDRDTGRWAVVLLILAYASFDFRWTMQPEGWMALTSMAAFAPIFVAGSQGQRVTMRHLVLAGAASGCFALIKPFYGLFAVVPLLAAAFAHVPSTAGSGMATPPMRAFVRPTFVIGAVSLSIVAIAVAWFAMLGTLDPFLEVHLLYTGKVYVGSAGEGITHRLREVLEFLRTEPVMTGALPVALAGLVMLWRSRQRGVAIALLAWLSIAVFCAVLQGKFYPYHWLPVLPPLLILFTTAVGLLRAEPKGSGGRVLATALLLAVCFKTAARPALHVAYWALYQAGVHTSDQYLARFVDVQIRPVHQRAAAAHIASRTTEDEGLAVWGFDAGLFMQANRPTPFRLAGWHWPMTRGTPDVRDAYRREYLTDFLRTRPRYMVVGVGASDGALPPTLRDFAALDSVLQRDYQRDTLLGPLLLLRRRDP